MKKSILWIVSILAAIVCLAGCDRQDRSLSDPVASYEQSLSQMHTHPSLSASLQTTRLIQKGEESYPLYTSSLVQYSGLSSDGFAAQAENTALIGSYAIPYTLAFSNGESILSINEKAFTQEMSGDAFLARFAPLVTLEPANYRQVDVMKDGVKTHLFFGDALKAESWAVEQYDSLGTAGGMVTLDEEGAILRSYYTVTYTLNGFTYVLYYTAQYDYAPVSVSPDITQHSGLAVEDIQIPLLTEYASARLIHAKSVSSQLREQILCQAGRISRNELAEIYIDGAFHSADTTVEQTDHAISGETTVHTQNESFDNGEYALSINGQEATDTNALTQEDMTRYCVDTLVSSILLPEYFTQISVTQLPGSVIRLEFEADTDLAKAVFKEACQILYDDAALVKKMEESFTAGSVSGYLVVDAHTFMPSSSGYTFLGIQTMDSHGYQMSVSVDQNYSFPATKNS